MGSDAMSRSSRPPKRQQRQSVQILNRVMAISSFLILGCFLVYLVFQAFGTSLGTGIRSLCAAALPPVVVTYLAYFVHRFHLARNNYLPRISIYILSMLWSLILFSVFANLHDSEQLLPIPIVELLFTATLVAFILMYRGLHYLTALAASYGLVSALLVFALLPA